MRHSPCLCPLLECSSPNSSASPAPSFFWPQPQWHPFKGLCPSPPSHFQSPIRVYFFHGENSFKSSDMHFTFCLLSRQTLNPARAETCTWVLWVPGLQHVVGACVVFAKRVNKGHEEADVPCVNPSTPAQAFTALSTSRQVEWQARVLSATWHGSCTHAAFRKSKLAAPLRVPCH